MSNAFQFFFPRFSKFLFFGNPLVVKSVRRLLGTLLLSSQPTTLLFLLPCQFFLGPLSFSLNSHLLSTCLRTRHKLQRRYINPLSLRHGTQLRQMCLDHRSGGCLCQPNRDNPIVDAPNKSQLPFCWHIRRHNRIVSCI